METYLVNSLTLGYGVHTSGCKVEREGDEEIKQVENPILIHAQEHKGKTFGDPRLVKRGLNYTQQWQHIRQ
jgi:hypothetical protein